MEGFFETRAGALRAADQLLAALPNCEVSVQELPAAARSRRPGPLRVRVTIPRKIPSQSAELVPLHVIRDNEPDL